MTSRRTRVAADLTAVLSRFGRYGLLLPVFPLVVPAALTVSPAHAHSNFAVDVRGGFNADKEEGLLGAGPALAVWRHEVGKDDTHFGVNLFGGVGATQGSFRPYGQAKFLIADAAEFSLAVGARF